MTLIRLDLAKKLIIINYQNQNFNYAKRLKILNYYNHAKILTLTKI